MSSFQQCVYITRIKWLRITHLEVWFTHSQHYDCVPAEVWELQWQNPTARSSSIMSSPGADMLVTHRSIFSPTSSFSSFLSCSPMWSTAVIESHSLGSTSLWRGQIRGDKTDSPSHSSLDLPCKLFHTPKLAKWPWWGKYQLSIIDYQDFLHIHLRAPLSSLINISQNVVREEHRRSGY